MSKPDENLPRSHEPASSLAWYAAGTLSERERRDVERHLETCAECRAELASIQVLRRDLRGAYDAEPGPSSRVKNTVLERIRASSTEPVTQIETFRRRELTPPRDERANRGWSRPLRVPQWASAAALLLIVVQAGFLLRSNFDRAPGAGEVTTRALPPQTTRLRAVFDPQASALQIRQVLSALGARIVDGPTSEGAYVVELPPGDPKTLAAKLKAARSSTVLQSLDIAQQ
jgi:anti-sigma factor RsiW